MLINLCMIIFMILNSMATPVVRELDYAKSDILNPSDDPPFDPLDYEHDIMERDLISDEKDRRVRNALRDSRALWKGRIIPYVFNTHLSQRAKQAVLDAIADYDTYTCIRFVPRDTKKHSDYVEFVRDKGCYSYVGRNGGRQTLSLGEGCEVKGIAIHEMMHVVGFMHEQSRSDRDSFVTVLYQNIPRKLWDQFDKMKSRQENNLNAKYDYNSVMHYSRKAFTANGRDTILPKIDGVSIGQRRGFSTSDVQKINQLYGCTEKSITDLPGSLIDSHATTAVTVHPLTTDGHLSTSTADPEDAQPVAISGGCVNRRNRLYCDLKRNMGWCRKSNTIAFEHCPLTCGTCGGHHAVTPRPPVHPEVDDLGSRNGTNLENEDCQMDSCCDRWKNCFEFHCVLYGRFCARTCSLCA